MQDLKIALIGATGKAGTYILKALLAQNFQVKALVRNPEKIKFNHSALTVTTGDVGDGEVVQDLINGCDVVISALGLGNPASEKTIFTQSTVNIINAMERLGLKRYIALTGLNVNTPLDNKDEKTRLATQWMYDHFPVSTANRQKEYDILTESKLDWTLIRLPLIMQTDEQTPIGMSIINCTGDQINATNLAQFVIDQLKDLRFTKQAPFIWNN